MTIAEKTMSRLCFGRYWRIRWHLDRYRRAFAYARNRLDPLTAGRIIYECQDAAEWWPLETFGLDGVEECALELYESHPELRRLAADACSRVSQKWSGTGDAASAAEDWALDLIPDYAEQAGITLIKVDPDA